LKQILYFSCKICLSLHTSSSLPEGCNLNVEIDYPEHLGVEPTVLCSSDCDEIGKTFYYRDEILEQEYNSIVQVSFDQEGNVICQIMSKDILKREALVNSTSEGEVGTTASDAESESISITSGPDTTSQSSVSNTEFDESTLDEFQSENSEVSEVEDQNQSSVGDDQYQSSDGGDQYKSSEEDQDQSSEEDQDQSSEEDQDQSSDLQTTLSNPEYTNDNSEVENQFNTSLKDDEEKVSNEPLYTSEEETEIEINKSESEEGLQEESQESTENTETPEDINNSSNTTENEIEGGTQISETESSTFVEEVQNEQQVTQISETESSTIVEELQNDQQVTDKNFETTQQEEDLNSQQDFMETTNQTVSPECSKGWTLNPNSKTCYLVTKNVMNWYDANIVCIQLGGKLSILNSPKEINFVKENIELPESSWIGLKYTLSDNLTFKTWRWIDRSIADFTDWGTGEPSSETSLWDSFWAYENCVEMKKSDGFAWNDERCTKLRRGLCSKQAELRLKNTCSDGWLMQNNKCYHFCNKDVTEEVANLHCSSYAEGVKLFVPEDQTEIVFVSDKLKEKDISSIWLGIKDTEESGDFKTPEGKLQTFFNWDFGEPSQSFWWFNTKECVEMSLESKMRRAKCSQELPFVCVLNL
ncbi:C-type mannose receptor 2, partial [Armadillidium nasatum]